MIVLDPVKWFQTALLVVELEQEEMATSRATTATPSPVCEFDDWRRDEEKSS